MDVNKMIDELQAASRKALKDAKRDWNRKIGTSAPIELDKVCQLYSLHTGIEEAIDIVMKHAGEEQ